MKKIALLMVIGMIFTLSSCQQNSPNASANFEDFGLVFFDNLLPVNSVDKEFSHFGVQYNGMPFHLAVEFDSLDVDYYLSQIPITAQAASELGLKWARVSVDWSSVEDNNGTFHWDILDATVAHLVDKKIEIYLCLHGGHRVHTSFRPPVKPQELQAWGNFAEKVITRYKDQINYWEIWNEGNSVWFWANNPDAGEYLQLVKYTTAIIDEIDPGSKVVGGNTARLDLAFSQELFDLGIADYIDVFTFHPYGHFPEANAKRISFQAQTPHWYIPADHQVDDLLAIVEKSGKDIEVWQGECGYPSQMNGMGWNGTGPWSENIQSKWIMRRALVDLSFNLHVSTYFLMKEAKNLVRETYNFKGLLRYADNHKKPAFYAYQNTIAALPGKLTSLRDHQATVTIIDEGTFQGILPRDIMTVLLQNQENKAYFAYWLVVRMQDQVDLGTADVMITDIELKDPVLVDLMTGRKYTVENFSYTENGTLLQNLPIADYPFIITER